MRQMSESQQLVVFCQREGMHGAWLKPKDWAKHCSLAKKMLEEVPGGLEEIKRVGRHGIIHVWPFSQGRTWDIFDLWEHFSKAMAEANARQLEAEVNPLEVDGADQA